MSNPISNFIRINSSKETFESIVNILIDEERNETTYSKFWPAPEGLTERDEYEWRMENHQCTKGVNATVNRDEQSIWFETNCDPAALIVERIAHLFPEARFEYGYTVEDDEEHDMFDVYENGILIHHEDEIHHCDWDDEEYADED